MDWSAVPGPEISEMIGTTPLMMDDKPSELVKPNPHIFTEIIPRHPDWWILTGDIKHSQRLKELFSAFNLR